MRIQPISPPLAFHQFRNFSHDNPNKQAGKCDVCDMPAEVTVRWAFSDVGRVAVRRCAKCDPHR